jgi:hypothetical protein
LVQSLDLTKRCIDDRKAVHERLAAAHAELMTQKSVGMANGGYVDMAAIAAVARELGTDFDVPDLAYIGAHPPLSAIFPVTCVAPMHAWLQL